MKNHRRIRIHAEIGHDTDWVREIIFTREKGSKGSWASGSGVSTGLEHITKV